VIRPGEDGNVEIHTLQTSPSAEAARPLIEKIGNRWTVASSMPTMPHSYAQRCRSGLTSDEWEALVALIRKVGYDRAFDGYGPGRPHGSLRYMNLDGHRYWTMGLQGGVVVWTPQETTILNRCLVDTPWEPLRVAPAQHRPFEQLELGEAS
jgi:hypothetical protein